MKSSELTTIKVANLSTNELIISPESFIINMMYVPCELSYMG